MTELSQKASLALSDLETGGGLLNPDQNETFIRRLEDSRTLLNAIRVVPMSGPTARINAIGFGDFITYPASQDRAANTTGHLGREPKEAYRSKPTTTHVDLATKEIQAVVHLPYEILEDSVERGALQNTIVALIADRVAWDLEAMVVRAVAAGSDPVPLLNYVDGFYSLATDHVLDAGGALLSDSIFAQTLKLMPKKYRNNLNALRFLIGQNAAIDMRSARSQRQTGLGDRFVEDSAPLRSAGVQCLEAGNNPENKVMLTIPQNLILGVQRNIRVETERKPVAREVIVVVTARVACEVENHDAVVVASNLGNV